MKTEPCKKCGSNKVEIETYLYTKLPGQAFISDQQVYINKISELVGTTASGIAVGYGQNPKSFFKGTTGIGLVKRFITCKDCGYSVEIEINS